MPKVVSDAEVASMSAGSAGSWELEDGPSEMQMLMAKMELLTVAVQGLSTRVEMMDGKLKTCQELMAKFHGGDKKVRLGKADTKIRGKGKGGKAKQTKEEMMPEPTVDFTVHWKNLGRRKVDFESVPLSMTAGELVEDVMSKFQEFPWIKRKMEQVEVVLKLEDLCLNSCPETPLSDLHVADADLFLQPKGMGGKCGRKGKGKGKGKAKHQNVQEKEEEVLEPTAEVLEPTAPVLEPTANFHDTQEKEEEVAAVLEPTAPVLEPTANFQDTQEKEEEVAAVLEPTAPVLEPTANFQDTQEKEEEVAPVLETTVDFTVHWKNLGRRKVEFESVPLSMTAGELVEDVMSKFQKFPCIKKKMQQVEVVLKLDDLCLNSCPETPLSDLDVAHADLFLQPKGMGGKCGRKGKGKGKGKHQDTQEEEEEEMVPEPAVDFTVHWKSLDDKRKVEFESVPLSMTAGELVEDVMSKFQEFPWIKKRMQQVEVVLKLKDLFLNACPETPLSDLDVADADLFLQPKRMAVRNK